MTYDDHNGIEIFHPELGNLTIIEHNHAGQVFCYDDRGHYHILSVHDPAMSDIIDYEITKEQEQFVDFVEEHLIDPDCICLFIAINDEGLIESKGRNMNKEILRTIIEKYLDLLREPHEIKFEGCAN